MWNLALDQNAEPSRLGRRPIKDMNKGLITIRSDKQDDVSFERGFYSLGHFSKFIDPNAYRINSNTLDDVMESVAFLNPDNSIAIVVSNRVNVERNIQIKWRSQSFEAKIPALGAATFKFSAKKLRNE
jgi:glucosylceramidase